MKATQSDMTKLIKNEVFESARKVRYYGYLARHLMRINNTLQFIGVIASCLAIFTLLGDLETLSLILLGTAAFTLTLSTLRNYASRSQRCSEISLQLARLHLDWQSLWNAARSSFDDNMHNEWKHLCSRQVSILEHVPLDLTLSPWLARRSQLIHHDYWTRALQPSPSPSDGAGDQAQSL